MVTSATPNALPLTDTQNTLIKLLTGMFGSAAGTLLDDAENILNQHQGDWNQLARALAGSELFHEHFYRRDLNNTAFANDFLGRLVGPNDGTLVAPAAYNSIRDWLVNRLEGREGERGQAMLELLVALHDVPANDPTWGQAHRQFIERSELAADLTQRLIASGQNHDTLDALLISRQLLDWGKLLNLQTLNTLPENGQNALLAAMQQLIQLGQQNPAVYQAWMPKSGNLQDLQNALPGIGQLADLLTFLNSALQRSDSASTVSNLIPTGGTDILAYFGQLRALNISLEKLLQTAANPGQELLALKALLQ
uniref:hypothetical protein n=1 Tax=Azonexus sp. TaxID=1872668 RepID=UPI0027BB18EC